jgi:predicted ATP-grasp superfamily ATP-dependent carboligase
MTKCILVIGVRRQCYRAAISLGHKVVLWADGEISENRKKGLQGWIEQPYLENVTKLSEKAKEELQKFDIERVIANTEETVIIGALVREQLGIKRLAVNVVERFHDKLVMKDFASDCGIPITKYRIIKNDTSAQSLVDFLGLPLVIKPVDESGAQDVKIARNLLDVDKYMSLGLLAEAFVEGSEVSVETFVQEGKPIFHNITGYLHQWRKSVVPADVDKDLRAQILKINDEIIEKFGVDRGMTHAEFYLTKDGPVFGEIAIRPPGGYYMDLIKRVYGFDTWELYVNLSCENGPADLEFKEQGCAAVYMIHPGAGKILSIEGVDKIKNKVKGIFEFSLRRELGDIILEHENTSNEVGHILFWSPDREQLNLDLEFIDANLKFELEAL